MPTQNDTTTSDDPAIIKLTNVRLSFPALFQPKAYQGSKPAYSATFLLDKKLHADLIRKVQAGIEAVMAEKWKGKKVKMKGVCLVDGSQKDHLDGYGDSVMFISTRNEKRIQVVDRRAQLVAEDDPHAPYPGCYVNAIIRLWAQDNEFGCRVNAQLRTVQFVRDGEPFGDKPTDGTKAFTDLGEDDGEGVI